MTHKPFAALVFAGLLTGACAPRPNAIAPSNVPAQLYMGHSCLQLHAEHERLRQGWILVRDEQNAAANQDAAGFLMFGLLYLVPERAINGTPGIDVATVRGHLRAIDTAYAQKGCSGYLPSLPG